MAGKRANLFAPPDAPILNPGSIVLATGTLMERARPADSAPPKRTRKVELTEENVKRIFGMSMRDLFKKLAEKFGYSIED